MPPSNLNANILTPAVEALANSLYGAVPRLDTNPYNLYEEMIQTNIDLGLGIEARILYGLLMMGDYSNSVNEKIQAFILDTIANMRGSWNQKVADMMKYIWVGHSFTLPHVVSSSGRWVYDQMQTIDPRKITYEGSLGEIEFVVYRGGMNGDLKIPYSHGLHVVNQPYLTLGGDPYGVAALKRVKSHWEAMKLGLMSGALAAKRQAFPLLFGKTDTSQSNLVYLIGTDGQPLIGTNGQPIQVTQGYSMLQMLLGMENGSVGVIDREDTVEAIAQQTDGQFLFEWFRFLQTSMLRGLLIPDTVVGVAGNGSGDSNLNKGHLEFMNTVILSQMKDLADAMIEYLFKPLIIENFGEQPSYGSFPILQDEKSDSVALLGAITNGIRGGSFGVNDIAVINRCRTLAGIEPIAQLPEPLKDAVDNAQPDSAIDSNADDPNADPNTDPNQSDQSQGRGVRSFFLELQRQGRPPK